MDAAYVLQMSTNSLSLCFGGHRNLRLSLQAFQLREQAFFIMASQDRRQGDLNDIVTCRGQEQRDFNLKAGGLMSRLRAAG